MVGSRSAVPAASSLVASELAPTKSLFVLTLDIPFNVVFTAPAALTSSTVCSRHHCYDHLVDDVANLRASPTLSSSGVSCASPSPLADEFKVERRYDKIMSRDVTPSDVTARSSRSERRPRLLPLSVSSRHDWLARPRSRSACNGKYCSVSGLQPLYIAADRKYWSAAGTRARPHSATTAPRRLHRPALYTLQRPVDVIGDATGDDDDDTASGNTTSSSGLADSGVTSSSSSGGRNGVITSRDTSPPSDEDEGRRVLSPQWMSMTDADRQNQLRRFLDALNKQQHHQHHHHYADTVVERQRQRHRQTTGRAACTVNGQQRGHLDTETPASVTSDVCQMVDWQRNDLDSQHHHQTTSAMDQVRQLVSRRQLPVYVSTPPPSNDAAHRLDKWKHTINHHATTSTPSTTSQTIERRLMTAAADLVSLSSADEQVARQLLTLSGRIQTYKLQLYSQHHRDVIDSAALDAADDDWQPAYVDLDLDRSDLLAASHLVRCGITRSHLHRRRRFSIL